MARTSNLDLSKVDLSRALRAKANRPAFMKLGQRINGFDTETRNGRVFMLTYCYAGKEPEAIHNDGADLTRAQIFGALTNRNTRAAANVWYNLHFDANVILANAVPKETLYELNLTGTATFDGWEITYLPRKCLILTKNKNRVEHWDIAQFFFSSLKKAAAEWLDEKKLSETVDVTKFVDPDYIKANFPTILTYAKRDAKLTRDLWRVFTEAAEEIGVPCGKPYSTGYLGEQTLNVRFRESSGFKPGFGSKEMQSLAWKAYRGGRFELAQRGAVGDVVALDIASAYPYQLTRLPDPSTLAWSPYSRPTLANVRAADWGLLTARVWTEPGRALQPFPVKSGILTFPILNGQEIHTERGTFLWALDNGFIRDFRLGYSWLGYNTPKTKYPFRFLSDLYETRKRFKAEGRDRAQLALKIVINSIYGKLCQLTEQKKALHIDEEGSRIETLKWESEMFAPPAVRKWLEDNQIEIHSEHKAGAYFNPFLATHTTARTRLELLKLAHETTGVDAVVMLATDSVIFKAEAYDAADFRPYIGSGLGEWEADGRGSGFFVGCGMYEIQPADGGPPKTRTRGFERGLGAWSAKVDGSLRAAAERHANGNTIEVFTTRPMLLAEAIHTGRPLDSVGVFETRPRGVSASMDRKRNWTNESPTFGDLLAGPEISKPLEVDPEPES